MCGRGGGGGERLPGRASPAWESRTGIRGFSLSSPASARPGSFSLSSRPEEEEEEDDDDDDDEDVDDDSDAGGDTQRENSFDVAEAMAAAPSVAPRPPAREPWLQKQRKTKQPALPSSFRRPRPT